ncbi:NRDE family protein [Peribacillus saganii]|uniref:NRDE family protein n=1 Tax=Peribacillus saganii TaxID=2303992 RepID=A0A372LSQ5_9BACI|nr:NRDE family protein [Peribacillus saganii]RFU71218.1 NRDE family protein [Peribacillus saganii]
MCLILFAFHSHPKYKLIVASNRDEFYFRPTAQAQYWTDFPYILAGRDLDKMGTWMGITTSGRFAALTNYRDPNENTEGKLSRGAVVADFLKGQKAPNEYVKYAAEKSGLYAGYNLLVGDKNQLFYYSNRGGNPQRLEPGIYGLSNHLLNTDWPKVNRGKEGLSKVLSDNDEFLVEQLMTLLQHADPAPDEHLPSTGVSLEWERILSPLFIKTEGYGTRSSAVMLMNDNDIYYKERTYLKGSVKDKEYRIEN